MEEIVSQFIVDTCELYPEVKEIHRDINEFLAIEKNILPRQTTVCGSMAEFYIQPFSSCIGDIDILKSRGDSLAFHSSQCKIPKDVSNLSDKVECFMLEQETDDPAYVRLRLIGTADYDWNHENYIFGEASNKKLLSRNMYIEMPRKREIPDHSQMSDRKRKLAIELYKLDKESTVKGPAVRYRNTETVSGQDRVSSIRCPWWPPAARNWPNRQRNSGWPNGETIRKVVQNGCDVVPVGQRGKEDDEYQWRLSFSRAEVILLQSWTPTQQIVYHLLRFFAKKEITKKYRTKEEEILCNYHLKTLMLWSCEEESPEWWETSSVIATCCTLLNKLYKCLEQKHCPNYFIPEANLLYYKMKFRQLRRDLKIIKYFTSTEKLSEWFMVNYVELDYQELFESTNTVLLEAEIGRFTIAVREVNKVLQMIFLDKLLQRYDENLLLEFEYVHYTYKSNSKGMKVTDSDNVVDFTIGVDIVTQVLSFFSDYFKALRFLHMSLVIHEGLPSSSQTYDVDFVSEILIDSVRESAGPKTHNYPMTFSEHLPENQVYYIRAEEIMSHIAACNSEAEGQLYRLLSMQCLQLTLTPEMTTKTSSSASKMYMAALHYSNGQQKRTIDLCLDVLSDLKTVKQNEMRSNPKEKLLKVRCLLFVKDLASIAGFLQLRRHILQMNFSANKQPLQIDLNLSPAIFALYLLKLCESKQRYAGQPLAAFEADVCFQVIFRLKQWKKLKTCDIFRPNEDREESDRISTLSRQLATVDALTDASLDFMIRFYSSVLKKFGKQFDLAPFYRALQLYRSRRYEDVLGLCDEILQDAELHTDFEDFHFLNIRTATPYILYFDEDLQTLINFLSLFYISDPNAKFPQIEFLLFNASLESFSIFDSASAYSRYKYIMCSLDSDYVIGRLFLLHYLKLRCFIDLDYPMSEIVVAFRCLRCRFPIEHIVKSFMRRKIIRLKRN